MAVQYTLNTMQVDTCGHQGLGLCLGLISVPIPIKSGKEIYFTRCFSVSSAVKFDDSLDWLLLTLILGVNFIKISQLHLWRGMMVCDSFQLREEPITLVTLHMVTND